MQDRRSRRLLVADDDPGVIAAYRIVLEHATYGRAVETMFGLGALNEKLFGAKTAEAMIDWRVDYAEQGQAAVAAVLGAIEEGDPYAAVFLDIRMPPGIDGREAARQIRELDDTVQIIVVTAYSDYTEAELKAAVGGSGLTLLTKPVGPEELHRVAAQVTGTAPDEEQ
jgi:CheY-like chemotaxis protein